ncbi:WhiB family transcriptional regulator [Mycobacterium sp. URHB0044]|jgi:WhiB family redox-sensing transcriptional regulator|uniref:WhiB family transcriptional regulator n=1 Tax=Mycobacterium sp. URHB0044 TaxID=1380386 RepID=UPI0007E8CB28|nr:WhiB family transcriptional regulator [Mycobacterium sp. URHB0044]
MTTNTLTTHLAAPPCSADPDLFFAGHTEREDGGMGGPTLAMMQRASQQSETARTACLLRCPLAQQRSCARRALDMEAVYGVWAGVQLPGEHPRKVPVLEAQREILRGIADGSIDPRTHPSNAKIMGTAVNAGTPASMIPRTAHTPRQQESSTAATA